MDQYLGTYGEEIVEEFCASYIATLGGSLDKRAIPAKQDPYLYIILGLLVYIYESSIHLLIYDPTTDPQRTSNTAKFDYMWQFVKSGELGRSIVHRELTKKWLT